MNWIIGSLLAGVVIALGIGIVPFWRLLIAMLCLAFVFPITVQHYATPRLEYYRCGEHGALRVVEHHTIDCRRN